MESSGTSVVFVVGRFGRERVHCYIGVYWWAVDMAGNWRVLCHLGLETVVMVFSSRSLLAVSVVRVARRLGRFRLFLLLCGFSF